MTLNINLFGAPSAGKSTMMALIFSNLKLLGYNVEMTPEYVKRKVWEESTSILSDQLYIFGKQYHSMHILQDKVDVVISDSPIILSLLYAPYCLNDNILPNFEKLALSVFNDMNNLNILLTRIKPYNPLGRMQTEEESNELYRKTLNLLQDNNIKFHNIESSEIGASKITDVIIEIINK